MTSDNPLLDALKPLLPKIARGATDSENNRRANPETMRMLKEIKFMRAFQPKKYGGLEINLLQFGNCVAALAGADAGAAWAASLLATHSHQMALFSAEAQEEFWGEDPEATASSSIAPFGKIREVEGGVIIDGEMKWSSGCDYAQWAILGFFRHDDEGNRTYCFGIVPRAEYEIIDDWFTLGIRGSGTKTLLLKEVFIPERRIQTAPDMMTGKSAGAGLYPDSDIFTAPYRPYFASGFAAVSLGIAERMLEVYQEKAANRVRAYTLANAGNATPALMRIAESTHQVAAARAFLEKTWQEHVDHGIQRKFPDKRTLTFWRTNQAYAVQMCIEATDRLFDFMGASCWYEDQEAQRLFRDMHCTGSHAYTDYDICKQILGRELMGLEPDPSMV